jgi:uncharacterized membrane protein
VVAPDLQRFVDQKRVHAAILRAEKSTDAAISVSIASHVEGALHEAALRSLHGRTRAGARGRSAVQFFVVPSRREFAVVGNASAHERLGQETWDGIVAIVQKHFREGDPTAGLVAGIEEAGRHLTQHFPRSDASRP